MGAIHSGAASTTAHMINTPAKGSLAKRLTESADILVSFRTPTPVSPFVLARQETFGPFYLIRLGGRVRRQGRYRGSICGGLPLHKGENARGLALASARATSFRSRNCRSE